MDWDLDRKVSAITIDNCSTNDAMINILLDKLDSSPLLLGETLLHMCCCAHILNLIAKDGLNVIRVGVEKIRDSVAYWIATPKRVEKFVETARQVKNLNTKKMGLDCATRWNSTYLMLQTALLYKDVFYRLKYKETQYTTLPSEEEWEFAREICGRFKIFYKATKYPTTNVAFLNLCEIRITISQWLSCSIEVVRSMASKMLGKFDKYWVIIHGLIGVAVVLDPRYKLNVLEFYFDKLYGATAEEKITKIRQLYYDLLQEYQRKLSLGTDANVESSTSSNFGYSEYPTLQAIARDFLAIPVSTVASESAFSTSGMLVSPYQSRFHPDTLEALMCAQSWLWAIEMQGNSTLESVGYATIYDDMDVNQSLSFFCNGYAFSTLILFLFVNLFPFGSVEVQAKAQESEHWSSEALVQTNLDRAYA
ncbi:zinc finger BED domain-containing protein RICESLEEPER 1-like [Camellia sinensis]|uniref:zinc finger BED domain-containing protein RICESLEEPER 1-like n=1 Tax=Camellia sinensis TaxID=4442 RepID=UPI0010356D29|nr:zinc finger BED domain-containing protein RICESLEEPER 1-like [Camellia sinensis]